MSSPRTLDAGASRARRIGATIAAALLLTCVSGIVASNLALAEDELQDSKQQLRKTKDKARARTTKVKTLQRRMNRLATRIARTEADVIESEHRIERLERKMTVLQARASLLQAKLDERNRQAYMFGGAPVLYVLTATSAADAASRMSFLNEMNRRDGVLASKVLDTEDRLRRVEAEVVRGRQILELTKQRLDLDRRTLRRKMAESQEAARRALRASRADPVRDLAHPTVCRVSGGGAARDRRRLRHPPSPLEEGGRHPRPPGQRHHGRDGDHDRGALRRTCHHDVE